MPAGGEARIRIIKTYQDPKSYFRQGDVIVFDRPLGIKRNAVVLPRTYELIACNVPSQILEEPDGRVGISFVNTSPAQAPLVLRARPATRPVGARQRRRQPAAGSRSAGSITSRAAAARAAAPARDVPMNRIRVSERAFQDREIVYFLKEPVDAFLQPLSRLHREPRRDRQVPERRPRRQHCRRIHPRGTSTPVRH